MIDRCAEACLGTRVHRMRPATGWRRLGRWGGLGLVLLAWFGFGLEGRAQSKRASLSADCSSIYVNVASTNDPVRGPIQTVFTTYDGSSTVFPIHATSGVTFSREVRPRANSPGVFETDFVRFFAATNGYGEWGSLVLNLPTDDSDGNGLPDFAQVALSVSTNFSGWLTNDTLGVSVGVTGTLQRSAGAANGLISLQTTNPAYVLTFTNVSWRVSSGTGGYFQYTRGATNAAVLRFTLTDPTGKSFDASATTAFTVLDRDTVTLAPCQLELEFSDASGFPTNYLVAVSGATFHRTGARYVGSLTLADGYAATPWPDYVNWVFVINDSNDTDGNGIPDLSDDMIFPPAIVVAPQGLLAPVGQTVILSVSAAGTAPLKYQWLYNNTALHDGGRVSGASTSNLVIAAAQAADGGSYAVIVSNLVGAVTSSPPAAVTLQPAPVIFSQPTGATYARGQTAFFGVVAGGQPPLAFQWFKDGLPLVEGSRWMGAITSNLVVSGLQWADAGAYTVVITNAVGVVTSQVATLTMDTSRVPPNDVIRLSETWVDRTVASSDGGSVFYDVETAYQGNITASLYWEGFSNLAFNSNTVFSVSLGHFNYTKRVSDAILTGSNSLGFLDLTFTNDLTNEKLQIGAALVRSGDTAFITVSNTEWFLGTNLYYIVMDYLDSGLNGAVQGTLPIHFRFGPYNSDKTLRYQGTVSYTYDARITNSDPLADPALYTILMVATNDLRPSVQITAPAPASVWPAPLVTVLGTATDDTGVAEVWWRLNGGAYGPAAGTTNWTASASLGSGSNWIEAVAFDLEGNASTSAVVSCYYRPLATYHSADTDHDGCISLLELTRVIELYNYRSGGARTGEYHIQADTEDGFAPGPGVQIGRPHQADLNGDWRLSLLELTRVIELYNYRSGGQRTGQYHAQSGTEDGFAPGP